MLSKISSLNLQNIILNGNRANMEINYHDEVAFKFNDQDQIRRDRDSNE